LDAIAGAIAVKLIRANDLFDPEHAFGGHQPLGFDQWMAHYDHYTVIGAKITVRFINNSTADRTPGLCGIMLTDTPRIGAGLTITDLNQLLENRYTTKGVVANVQGSDRNTATATMTFSAKKFFHKSNIVGDSLYRGTSTTGPEEDVLFEIWQCGISGANPDIIALLIEVDYIAVLTEPRPLPSS